MFRKNKTLILLGTLVLLLVVLGFVGYFVVMELLRLIVELIASVTYIFSNGYPGTL